MSVVKLTCKQEELINNCAQNCGFENFEIDANIGTFKGDNYLGVITTIKLKEKDSDRTYHLILKSAHTSENFRKAVPIAKAFACEAYIYNTILPRIFEFQTEKGITDPFTGAAKYYDSCLEDTHESILLKDLKKNEYKLWNRKVPMDDQHVTMVFSEYARFHAASLALKHHHPIEFDQLTKNLQSSIFENSSLEEEQLEGYFDMYFKAGLSGVEGNMKATTALEKLRKKIKTLFLELKDNRDKNHEVVIHGDSWCNNMLFHYKIFRHGNRTPDADIYAGNPYGDKSFYEPYGFEQLTNEGKRTEYKLGQALRTRYDSFLGNEYNIDILDARCDTANRTKMSLLLVTAALFPPRVDLIWNDTLNWQPIPYNYYEQDKEIRGHKVCTNYDDEYKALIKTDEIQDKLKVYQDMFDYLTAHTGEKIEKPKKAADLYMALNEQKAYGYPLEEWTDQYMTQMKQITLDNYAFMTYTHKLKKIISGYLIKKIIADSEDQIANGSSKKMYLYSTHESNVAALLNTLEIFDNEIPSFGSYVLIEVHRIDGLYGFKVYYQNYKEENPILMTIPGCNEFCYINDFKTIVDKVLPDDNDCDLP